MEVSEFREGVVVYDQFLIKKITETKRGIKKLALACTDCGKEKICHAISVARRKPVCYSCRKKAYQAMVAAEEAIAHRVCKGCGRLLPREKFRPRIGCKDYINPYCRECEVLRFKYPENLIDPVTGLKRCARCKQYLPRECFAEHPDHPDGLKSWCEKCNKRSYQESLYRRGLALHPDVSKRLRKETSEIRKEEKRIAEEKWARVREESARIAEKLKKERIRLSKTFK